MKLQFEPDLDYQQDAIAAVCDLFKGQEACRTEFTVSHNFINQITGFQEGELGVGNRLQLPDEALLQNLRQVQLRNGLFPEESLRSRDFTVEMETGTGKTYVYLRTIFELNRRYGFTKFAIVVPSVAIKEGVNKSLEIIGPHLRALYSGMPFEHFVYDSTKLGQVRNFAASPQVQIMVVTVGAINKRDVNNVYQPSEKTGGEKPIDLIRATNPVLIVDEPQSVDGGLKGQGRQALKMMNPLCTLRYSATHVDKHHMVYRLNAVDAYAAKLVKQIEVAAGIAADDHNRPYVRLVETRRQRGNIWAVVEVDQATPTGVRRCRINVTGGDRLEHKTHREIYKGHRIGDIRVERGNEQLELMIPGKYHWMRPGEIYGGVDPIIVHREMIRKTIHEHLDKESRLRPLGIKVLTLFFIDKVARYRRYDEDGNSVKGEHARIFEEEYQRAAELPKYRMLFEGVNLKEAAESAHEGYFSIDRKGGWTDTDDNNQINRDNSERAYRLIMREKERLLSFGEPLKFIFSHSALREGWDNPNVFQICALRDISTERERRQTVGRGLRLCVNQKGERQRGFEINTLTVVARESYEEFADNLQREIEEETGIVFGRVEQHSFAFIIVEDENDQSKPLGVELSRRLWEQLVAHGYLDTKGQALDALKEALDGDGVRIPAEFEPLREEIIRELRKSTTRIKIKNSNERRRVQPREAVLDSAEFQALWDRIKHKTTFRVQFDNEKMLEACAKDLADAPPIPRPRLIWQKGHLILGRGGIEGEVYEADAVHLEDTNIDLPDLLTDLQNRTGLTRRGIYRILVESNRLDDFLVNPAMFIEIASETINRCKRSALVNGIKYERLGNEHYFCQELFRSKELNGYLKNMVATTKSVYDYVIYDSKNEATFAKDLEKFTAVKVYAKLPRWFQVPTPLGPYNPDWAVLIEEAEGERLYLVVETKGSAFLDELRNAERAKVKCGEAHFKALEVSESPAHYIPARKASDLFTYSAQIKQKRHGSVKSGFF